MHYVYPYPHVDQVIELMAAGKILPYLDIPFQHANPRILKLMKRPAAAENTLERIAAWRRIAPDMAIRSTFIVGFPGETEQEFSELLDWLREAQLDRVGCFEYSPVEGAAANALGAGRGGRLCDGRAACAGGRYGADQRRQIDRNDLRGPRTRLADRRLWADLMDRLGGVLVASAATGRSCGRHEQALAMASRLCLGSGLNCGLHLTIHQKPENVRSRVMVHHVEVELAAHDLPGVELRHHQPLGVEGRAA